MKTLNKEQLVTLKAGDKINSTYEGMMVNDSVSVVEKNIILTVIDTNGKYITVKEGDETPRRLYWSNINNNGRCRIYGSGYRVTRTFKYI